MEISDYLISRIQKQLDMLFAAARRLPADKLDWKPAPGARSAIDQLQEIATSVDTFWDAHAERKMVWSDETMAKWQAERSKLTTLDELEAKTRESHERLFDFIRTVTPDQMSEPVEMPFPEPFDLAYVLTYYFYNAAYHEGQINYIGSLLKPAEA